MASAKKTGAEKLLAPPVASFTSPGGRRFTVARGLHEERFKGDTLWSDKWPILYNGKQAGKLFRNLNYGTGAGGHPRWQATIRELFWTHAAYAPTGVGFDVAAFDTAKEALVAWARSADQILDFEAGKSVRTIHGTAKKKTSGDVRGRKPWSKSNPVEPKPKYRLGDRVRVTGTKYAGKVVWIFPYDDYLGDHRYKIEDATGTRVTFNGKSLALSK